MTNITVYTEKDYVFTSTISGSITFTTPTYSN